MNARKAPEIRNYFVLGCEGPYPPTDIASGPDLPGPPWMTGRPVTWALPDPLIFELDPDYPGEMMAFYTGRIPVMRDDLLDALRDAGVDNLQVYSAIVRDTARNIDHRNYKAVNIIGAVAAADLGASKVMFPQEPHMVDMTFESLAVDESKIGGLLMFRLAESVNAIMVHRCVKERIESRGIAGMVFYDPLDWAG